MTVNIITGTIEINPTLAKPYFLVFEYKGKKELKERVVNFSHFNGHFLCFKERLLLKSRWIIDTKERYDPIITPIFLWFRRIAWWANLHLFWKQKKAKQGLIETKILLNEYLGSVEKDYERLLLEKDNI